MNEIKHILMPTDCSDLSREAVEYAINFAKTFKAKLTLLNVNDDVFVMGLSDSRYQIYQQMKKANDEFHKKQLMEFWQRFNDPETETELVEVEGDPFTEIINFAKQEQVDLIVMGTHGRTGLQHILLGSVTEKVVRYSPYPVLTVKHKNHSYTPLTHS